MNETSRKPPPRISREGDENWFTEDNPVLRREFLYGLCALIF
ncbi:MAG: hypothetical protein V4634_15165 [Pseudomonadota bacterium]